MQIVGCLFALSLILFVMEDILSLIRSYLFMFVSFSLPEIADSKNIVAIYFKECSVYVFL